MRSSPKAPSTFRYLLITFIILLVLVGYYWFNYIPFREGYFTNRNLRLLSDMSENITKIIESYKGQLDKNFINRDKSIFQMIVEQGHAGSEREFRGLQKGDCLQKDIAEGFIQNQMKRIRYLSYRGGNVCLGTERFPDSITNLSSTIDYQLGLENDGYVIHMNYLGKRLPRQKTRYNSKDDYTYTVDLKMAANLTDIISPFLKSDIFDNILLIEHSTEGGEAGRVVYQADQSSFRVNRLDSLTSNLKETWSSYHEDVVWGNNAYKLFVQPVRIALMGQQKGDETTVMEWMLVGLVDASRLNADARAISRFFISQWTFIFFLVLFSIPLIKLNFIGEREELKRSDVIMTIFSIFVLSGVLTFWLLSYYSDRSDLEEMDGALKPLAENMERNLYQEVGDAIEQFHQLNEKFTINRQRVNAEIRAENIAKDKELDTIPVTGFTVPEIFSTDRLIFNADEVNDLPYPLFKFFAWIDSSGMQTRKLSTLKEVTPLVQVGHRQYFRRILDGHYWKLDNQPFYIEPIISITTGENIAVLSIPDTVNPEPVNMMTLNFMSLVNPVMPKGTGFCVVNEEGLVLFHSSQKKNMQENFFVECNDPSGLASAVFSRVEKTLTVDYLGREHRLHVKPFDHIPNWTLITFADLWKVRSSELNAMSSAFSLYTVMVLSFLMILLFYLFFRYFKILTWFWPREENDGKYRRYSTLISGLAGLYYAAIFHLSADANLLTAIVLTLFTAIGTAMYFRRAVLDDAAQGNTSRLVGYITSKLPTREQNVRWVFGVSGLLIGFLFLHWIGWYFGAYGVLGLTIGLILNFEPITTWISTKKFPNYYARFAFSGVAFFLMTSILPAIALFKISYDAEKEILVKSGQHSLFRGIQEREARVNAAVDDRVMMADNREYLRQQRLAMHQSKDIYSDFFYSTFLVTDLVERGEFTPQKPSFLKNRLSREWQDSLFGPVGLQREQVLTLLGEIPPTFSSEVHDLLGFLRGRARIVDFRNWELHQENAVDKSWNWKRWLLAPGTSFLLFDSEHLGIVSNFAPLAEPNSLLWILGMIAVLALLYLLMTNFIHKVFGISLSVPMMSQNETSPLLSVNQNTIYIGQPNSGKSRVVNNIEDRYHRLDLREVSRPEELMKHCKLADENGLPYKVIVVDHFDLRFDEILWNSAILELLESLINKHDKLVLLITTIDPTLAVPRLTRLRPAKELEGVEKADEVAAPEIIVDKNYLNRWTMLLSSFTKIYHRIHTDDTYFMAAIESRYPDIHQLKERDYRRVNTLVDECKHTSFLQSIGLDILKKFDVQRDFINDEVLIDEILLRSEAYYESIWSTCSIDEKITLIHLARNNFVPHKDARVVRLLMRKGLVSSNQYRLLNKSFADFVMTAESSAVIETWKRNQVNSWDNIRTPLITFVLVIIAFIFVTQRQLFNVSIAWITTFAALIPAFFRVVSMVRPRLGIGRKAAAVSEDFLGD